MNQNKFTGKTILVTGASSGIGRQIAVDLTNNGASVILSGRNLDRLNETQQLCTSGLTLVLAADLSNEESANELAKEMLAVNGVVHCAGTGFNMPLQFIKKEHIEEVLGNNLYSAIFLIRALLSKKRIKQQSSLVFFSSLATRFPVFGGSLYACSKAAVEGFSYSLSIELQSKNIRSNCIRPAFVETPMISGIKDSLSDDFVAEYQKEQPYAFGKVSDVSKAVQYLLSDDSRWINGQVLELGGFNVKIPSL